MNEKNSTQARLNAARAKQWKALQRLHKQEAFEKWVRQQLANMRLEGGEDSTGSEPKTPTWLKFPPPATILYAKGCGSYSEIVTDTSRQVLCCPLSDIERHYGKRLFRIHRSYLVNLMKIDAIGTHHVLTGGQRVPVSGPYRPTLRKALGLG